LVLNNLLLATACATVFLGTLYPLFLDTVGGPKVSVGGPYFNATFVPLMIPVLIVMAIGPLLHWKRGDLNGALGRLKAALIAAAVIALLAWWLRGGPALAFAGIAIAVWLVVGAFVELAERIKLFRGPIGDSLGRLARTPRAAIGMTIAHGAMGIIVAGITASSAWRSEHISVMRPGETATVAGYTIKLDGVGEVPGPNYVARRATLTVTRNGAPVTIMTPEKRFFPVQGTTTTEAAIHTTLFADLYAVLGDPGSDRTGDAGGWVIRLYHNPLVPWIWLGAALMAFGGAVSLSDRRHRIGAPVTSAQARGAHPAGAPA
jgi:cytochrome c-type biogenesis protein CcmF